MYKDEFGYLNYAQKIDFIHGVITPLPEFEQNYLLISKNLNKDGFIYPPAVNDYSINWETYEKTKIENTEKPAELFKIAPSHSIEIFDPIYVAECRKWDSNFIIQLLAFIKGVRLQFSEWWFDGRIPIVSQNNFGLYPKLLEQFVIQSYNRWRKFDTEYQKWFINILFMHNKSISYTWDWEKFMVNYTVFDGIYRLYTEINSIKKIRIKHEDRLLYVCKALNIPVHEEYIKNIYSLRNDLFHQAIWDGGLPTSSEDKYKGYYQHNNLRRLNIRAIIALLEFETEFIQTPWWFINKLIFDRTK